MSARKRNRATRVCDFCKRRKVKCNLGNPCSTCAKYGNNDCRYNDIPINYQSNNMDQSMLVAPESAVQDELEVLKQKIKSLEQSINSKTHTEPSIIQSPTKDPMLGPKLGSPAITKSTLDVLIGHNPVASSDDTINFYEGYTSVHDQEPFRRKNYGPLSWIALVKADNATSKMWAFVHELKKSNDLKLKMLVVDKATNYKGSEKHFHEKATDDEGYNDIRLYKDASSKPVKDPYPKTRILNSAQVKNKINEMAMSLGHIFYEGKLDEELELIKKIELVLPKKSVIWKLFNRFFTHLYPFVPFVDEVRFKEQIQNLIGPESFEDEMVSQLKVEKRLDFAHLGLLLIILRLTYLTLFTNIASINEANLQTNDPSPHAQEIKYLLSNPVNLDVIDIAQVCLNQFNLLRSANMSILQLAFYTRIYHMYAPEEGDGIDGGDSGVFTAMLFQMAYSMGLHRDPDNFHDQCNDERTNNLGRKIWYFLLILDVNNAMNSGLLLNANNFSFDTKPPFYRPGNANIKNIELEKATISSFSKFETIFESLSELIRMVLNVKGAVKMEVLTTKLNFLESHFIQEYGKLKNQLDKARLSPYQMHHQILRTKIYFTTNFFLVSLFFHFFNYYESKNNSELAFYYIKKIIVISIHDLMPFYHELLENSHIIFKNSTDLIVTPGFEMAIHKTITVIIGIFIRVKIAIIDLESNYNHQSNIIQDELYKKRYGNLLKTLRLLEKCYRVFFGIISTLSQRYYYAWRITKAQSYLLDIITKNEFYEKNKLTDETNYVNLSNPMLEELIDIFETTLAKIKVSNKRKHSDHMETPPNPRDISTTDTFASEDIGTANSIESSSTDDSLNRYEPNEYFPNNQIDNLWIQMMSIKKDNEPNNMNKNDWNQHMYQNIPNLKTNNSNNRIDDFANIANYNDFGFDGAGISSQGINDNDDNITGEFNNDIEFLEPFPFEELFSYQN